MSLEPEAMIESPRTKALDGADSNAPARESFEAPAPDGAPAPAPNQPPRPVAEPVYDIEVRNFTHRYGSFVAVDNLSLRIPRGTITGFIGPNGAGKTTTITLLCTLLNPTAGDARVCGFSCSRQRAEVRKRLGYMPDRFGVYEGLTAREYLQFFAEAMLIERSKIRAVIGEAVELLRLGDLMRVPVDGLSRGQLQRLSLARALLHDPQVMILDEPASGLDPLARLELLYILRELRSMGKTLFLSSHILSEISECCDYLAIMSRGKLVAFDRLDSIRHRVRPHYSIEVVAQGRAEETLDAIRANPRAANVRDNVGVIEFDFVGDEDQLVALHRALILAGLPIVFFQPVEVSLEDAFAMLIEPDAGEAPLSGASRAANATKSVAALAPTLPVGERTLKAPSDSAPMESEQAETAGESGAAGIPENPALPSDPAPSAALADEEQVGARGMLEPAVDPPPRPQTRADGPS